VQAVGITLSSPQQAWAAGRLAAAGAGGQAAEIRVQDYRLVDDGPYDAVSSIGMSEHVGEASLPGYFSKLHALLRPGGRLLNHAISSLPARHLPGPWPAPLRLRRERSGSRFGSGTFIARYVFPDGELVEVGRVVSAMQRAGLEVRHVESLREHYPLTLRRWLANLEGAWPQAVHLIGERRARAWRLYLAGSIFSFEAGRIAVHQVLAVRPEGGRSGMPLRPRFEERPVEPARAG
jgi:cyclopropane-fatty-acyl-phospholipid synthase